jgi:two-component system nitrogen regulation response regulator GlnG
MSEAARELDEEPKVLRPEVVEYLARLDWPGNVRQLENTARWLTVMASGREVHLDDLPPELRSQDAANLEVAGDWETDLRAWAERRLLEGGNAILDEAVPTFERAMIETALKFTAGHRQDAARLLGWGRNTLTRKIKELGLSDL